MASVCSVCPRQSHLGAHWRADKPDGLTGEFVDLGVASEHEVRDEDLKGKIVLVKRDVCID